MEHNFKPGDIVVEEDFHCYRYCLGNHEVGVVLDDSTVHWFAIPQFNYYIDVLDITKLHCPKDKLF